MGWTTLIVTCRNCVEPSLICTRISYVVVTVGQTRSLPWPVRGNDLKFGALRVHPHGLDVADVPVQRRALALVDLRAVGPEVDLRLRRTAAPRSASPSPAPGSAQASAARGSAWAPGSAATRTTGTFSALVVVTKSAETQPTPPDSDGAVTCHQRPSWLRPTIVPRVALPGRADDREVGARARADVEHAGAGHGARRRLAARARADRRSAP